MKNESKIALDTAFNGLYLLGQRIYELEKRETELLRELAAVKDLAKQKTSDCNRLGRIAYRAEQLAKKGLESKPSDAFVILGKIVKVIDSF